MLKGESKGGTASVTVKVQWFVVIGEVRQIERYTLKNMEGHWLMDAQEIEKDRVIGRTLSIAGCPPRFCFSGIIN